MFIQKSLAASRRGVVESVVSDHHDIDGAQGRICLRKKPTHENPSPLPGLRFSGVPLPREIQDRDMALLKKIFRPRTRRFSPGAARRHRRVSRLASFIEGGSPQVPCTHFGNIALYAILLFIITHQSISDVNIFCLSR